VISYPQIVEAVPIIISLILIEGLLSVDNALAIAAMASHLPEKERKLALRIGIFCAYLFRGIALALVSWIQGNLWIKWFGASYLIYLMCAHLTADEGSESHQKVRPKGLIMTVLSIELMDLTLSIDNVIAAVALSNQLWVIITGVFIAILTLRLLAVYAIGIIQRFPVLAKAAFILVGYVGFLLMYEMSTGHHAGAFGKFSGICLILAATLAYGQFSPLRTVLAPILKIVRMPMRWFAQFVGLVVWPITFITSRLRGNSLPA